MRNTAGEISLAAQQPSSGPTHNNLWFTRILLGGLYSQGHKNLDLELQTGPQKKDNKASITANGISEELECVKMAKQPLTRK